MIPESKPAFPGKAFRLQLRRFARRWSIPAFGALALLWFIVRVVPKPSRALYPCMQASFPVASGFVAWLLSLLGMRLAWRRLVANLRGRQPLYAGMAAMAGLVAGAAWITLTPESRALAASAEEHVPIGEGKGVFPGRVVYVHAPAATDWPGKAEGGHWSAPDHVHGPTVGEMLREAVLRLGGGATVAASWEAMFRHFNVERGRGARGYVPGEKVMIKTNLTLNNATMGALDADYDKVKEVWLAGIWNNTEVAPQTLLALLRHLVYEVGVEEADIFVGDPVCLVPNYVWKVVHPEFPEVTFVENHGHRGRVRAEFSDVPFYWSTEEADGKEQDYLPRCYAEAAYLINLAVPKSHGLGGITACAKNHYGSFIRTPVGNLWGSDRDYYNLHKALPGNESGTEGTGHYRTLVDIMGHGDLGGKTLLYLLDGLFAGQGWDGNPVKWNMDPFNGDWPSCLFASMDPVAIDSVAYDFLVAEWPELVLADILGPGGAEDYLHEAALAGNPPSGTFYDPERDGKAMGSLGVHEHWNNPVQKQYSRNLGGDRGIELVRHELTGAAAEADPSLRCAVRAGRLRLRAINLDPEKDHVVERINPFAGEVVEVRELPGGVYGTRSDLPFDSDAPFLLYRVRSR